MVWDGHNAQLMDPRTKATQKQHEEVEKILKHKKKPNPKNLIFLLSSSPNLSYFNLEDDRFSLMAPRRQILLRSVYAQGLTG